MNEKIKELALQAGLEFDDDLSITIEPIYYITQGTCEKFAELIIQECSKLCYTSHLKDSDAHAMNILDHFDIDGMKHWK
jgi:hypothetical protein